MNFLLILMEIVKMSSKLRAKCTVCGLEWSVSNRTVVKKYVCPYCEDSRSKKREGTHRSFKIKKNVLERNKRKYAER